MSRKDLMLHKKGAGSNLSLLLRSVGTKFCTKRALSMLRKEDTLTYAGLNERAPPQRSLNNSWGNSAAETCPGWQEHRERGREGTAVSPSELKSNPFHFDIFGTG